jgi:small conductance mechanosensitive channel
MNLLADASYFAILIIGVYGILIFFGFQVTGIIAMITAISFAVGLSLQGTLSDFASGVVLSILSPYRIGDIIKINDITGIVVDFTIINTVVENGATKILTNIPNSKIQGNIIENISRSKYINIISNIRIDSNKNNVQYIINTIKKDLENTHKYPFIIKGKPVDVVVDSMASDSYVPGTVISVVVPIIPEKLIQKKAALNYNVYQLVSSMKVTMPSQN